MYSLICFASRMQAPADRTGHCHLSRTTPPVCPHHAFPSASQDTFMIQHPVSHIPKHIQQVWTSSHWSPFLSEIQDAQHSQVWSCFSRHFSQPRGATPKPQYYPPESTSLLDGKSTFPVSQFQGSGLSMKGCTIPSCPPSSWEKEEGAGIYRSPLSGR